MYKIKSHEYEDMKKFKPFVEHLKDAKGHIGLKVRSCYEHGITSKDYEVGAIIDENKIERFIYCEIYYLDESENYPEYIFVGMNGTIIIAQDMLHYGIYHL